MSDSNRNKNVKNDQRQNEIEDKIASGPQEERGCTDILCCLIFIAFIVLIGFIGIRGYVDGEPKRMIAVYDSSYFPCGMKTDVDGTTYDLSDYDYIYFATPTYGKLDRTYCVDKCPSLDKDADADDVYPDGLNCNLNNYPENYSYQDTNNKKCKNTATIEEFALMSDSEQEESFIIYDTNKLLGRICFPGSSVTDAVTGLASSLTDVIDMDKVNSYLDDLDKGKWIVLASVGIVFVLGVLYMLFVRVFAGIIVWLITIMYLVLLALLTYFVYDKYDDTKTYLDDHDGEEYGDNTDNNKNLYLVLTIVFGAIFVISILAFLCMFNSIRLAIAIIKTATQFVTDVPSTMLVPIIMGIVVACWWVLWAVTFMFVYSVGDIVKKNEGSIFAKIDWSKEQEYYVWIFVFGGLWINAFLQALTQFVLASTCSIWYWDQPDKTPHRPVLRSFYRAFRYHLGSLAFGSFILAVVQLIRIILEYIYRQQQKTGATENKIMKAIWCYLRCFIACFERFIKFMNKIAYIQIALSGDNFCKSCYFGMTQVFNNKTRFVLVSGLGSAFVFVGKVFMICSNVFICYMIYTKAEPYKSEMSSTWLPLIIIFCLSWGISTVFLSIYSMAISTVLLCFLYDEKINSKNPAIKMKAPEPLQDFIKEHNEKQKQNQVKQG